MTFLMGWYFNWRAVAWCCSIVTLIPAALVFFIPESPSWLISQGRTEDAHKSLAFINRHQPQPINTTKTFTDLQLTQLLQDHEWKMRLSEQSGTSKWNEFLKPTGYKPLLILWCFLISTILRHFHFHILFNFFFPRGRFKWC